MADPPTCPTGRTPADGAPHQSNIRTDLPGWHAPQEAALQIEIDNVKACRASLWKAGFPPVALETNGKRPVAKKWPDGARRDRPQATVREPSSDALNTGILCDGLRILDFDVEDAGIVAQLRALAVDMFGETIVRTRGNSVRCAIVYRAAEGQPGKRAMTGIAGKIEVLGHGQQLHAFGKHPSGAELTWHPASPEIRGRDGVPAVSEEQITAYLAAAAPLIGGPIPGASPAATPVVTGLSSLGPRPWFAWPRGLPDLNAAARRTKFTLEEVEAAIESIPDGFPGHPLGGRDAWLNELVFPLSDFAVRHPEHEAAVRGLFVEQTRRIADPVLAARRSDYFAKAAGIFDREVRRAKQPSRNDTITIGRLIHSALGNREEAVAAGWGGRWDGRTRPHPQDAAAASSTLGADNGAAGAPPRPIPSRLLPVPTFDWAWLPRPVQRWAWDLATTLPAPLDYVGINVLVAAGSIIGNRLLVNLKQKTLWLEAPNFWGLCIGDVSTLKSPTATPIIRVLGVLEAAEATRHQQAAAQYEAARRMHQALTEQAGKLAQQAAKAAISAAAGGTITAPPALVLPPPPVEPKMRRYYTTDTSYEALGALCAANQSGILVWGDELSGLLSALDTEENRSARAFYLAGWNGQMPYVFDRIARGYIRLERFALGVLGNVQPGMVARFLTDAGRRGAADGLAQRFGAMVWPDPVEREYRDRPVDPNGATAAATAFQKLAALDPAQVGAVIPTDGAPWVDLAPGAHAAFRAWLEAEVYATAKDDSLPDAYREHVTKMPKVTASIALIIHLMEQGAGSIPLNAMQRAIGVARYLAAHARRVYEAAGRQGQEAARLVAKRISAGTVTGDFTMRDARRRRWSGFADEKVAADALEDLEELGWINRTDVPATVRGGRPTVRWTVNPLGRGAGV